MREAKGLNDLIGNLSGQQSVALIRVLSKMGTDESSEEEGKWLEDIFQRLSGALNGIKECRISWDELLIFQDTINPQEFEGEIIRVLGGKEHPRLETHSLFDSINGDTDDSLSCIDKMQLQLHKIGYWTEHIYDHYYIDGKKEIL